MIERFHDPTRAIAYLCEAMRHQGADDKVLVTSYLKGHKRARTHVTECMHMVPVLERFCEHFSEAVAIWDLHYGPYTVGGIQCHCYPKLWKLCPQQCRNHKERPLVTVVAFKEDLDITDEERLAILTLVEEEIDRQASNPEDRIGRHGKAANIHRH
ncbi:MAG: hypothetical protein HUU46_06850 [Candidatus Hydrogenedentes bacterium]|nr:hypothetical protein [Candidatus Hydrogenedentota bacterium]